MKHNQQQRNVGKNEMKRNRSLQSSAKCVNSKVQLKTAVSKSKGSATIRVCSDRIRMGAAVRRMLEQGHPRRLLDKSLTDGIDLTNKTILFACRTKNNRPPRRRRCTLDGEGLTRIFYGSNATIEFKNIRFANGYHDETGGAILLENDSKLKMTNCSLWNNSAPQGAAILVKKTDVVMNGGGGKKDRSTLIKSTGNSAPFDLFNSTAKLNNVYFADNDVSALVSHRYLFFVNCVRVFLYSSFLFC
jgi:hypothetical protein